MVLGRVAFPRRIAAAASVIPSRAGAIAFAAAGMIGFAAVVIGTCAARSRWTGTFISRAGG